MLFKAISASVAQQGVMLEDQLFMNQQLRDQNEVRLFLCDTLQVNLKDLYVCAYTVLIHMTLGTVMSTYNALCFVLLLPIGCHFLAELFTTAMFFNWKGARTKSHEKWDFIVILGLWLVNERVTWLFEWDFWSFWPIFTTEKVFLQHLFTTFSPHFHHNLHHRIFSWHLFTTFSPQSFTTKGQTDRDKQTTWGCTDRFSPQIYTKNFTTDFHYKFSPQIYTTDFDHRSHSHESVIWGTNRQKLT